jgi:hypothetical protein
MCGDLLTEREQRLAKKMFAEYSVNKIHAFGENIPEDVTT